MSECGFIELRVAYPGHPYIALIAGLDESDNLNRRWIGDDLYHRREQVGDGSQEQVYRFPLVDAMYEIAETISGFRARRYVAVCQGTLHRLTRDAVESIAEGSMTLEQLVSKITDRQDGGVL